MMKILKRHVHIISKFDGWKTCALERTFLTIIIDMTTEIIGLYFILIEVVTYPHFTLQRPRQVIMPRRTYSGVTIQIHVKNSQKYKKHIKGLFYHLTWRNVYHFITLGTQCLMCKVSHQLLSSGLWTMVLKLCPLQKSAWSLVVNVKWNIIVLKYFL